MEKEIEKFCADTGVLSNNPKLSLLIEKSKLLGHNNKENTFWWMHTLADLIKEPKRKSLCDCGEELHLDEDVVRCQGCGKTFWMKKAVEL